jgi:small conductance mechanosensitive channel
MNLDADNPNLTGSPLVETAVDAVSGAADGTDSAVAEGLGAILPDLDILQKLMDELIRFATTYTFQLIGAAIILFLGALLARFGGFFFSRWFRKRELDVTLSKFIVSCIRWTVVGFAVIIALGKFGITITPFVAALGALTFGASLAVQGPVSNFTSGLIIIFTRPFVVDDTISVNGSSGIVREIKLGYTQLRDEDGVLVIVPNKQIIGEVIVNSNDWRLVEASVGISYENDPERAIAVIHAVLAKTEGVLLEVKPVVGLEAFADSSLVIAFRYRVQASRYFDIAFRVNLGVHKALQEAELTIPFPQRDVHLFQA